jgi:ribose transport system ATP-binding protein
MSATPELLTMTGIVKEFPGVRALDGVDLDVRAGEVHCLLGQNGAGKSTLIRVLTGAHQPDAGTIRINDEAVQLTSPTAAIQRGIAAIYQELDLVPELTVAENIFLGHEPSRYGFSRTREVNTRARAILQGLGHAEIPTHRTVGSLPAAGQQVVSMARALSRDARLIVMDEPSAVLDPEEVSNLFRVIRGLTDRGVAVVYISHRLEEIRQIGDRVTVLKDGATVATGLDARETPTRELIQLMTGRSIEYVFPPRNEIPSTAPVVLEVVNLTGLVGSGRSEVLETVYGARRPETGVVRVNGVALRPGRVQAAVKAGVGLAPEERKSQALLLDEAVYKNITVSTLGRFASTGFLNNRAEREAAQKLTRALDVRPAGVDQPVRNLSGGNQQKVVLARWLLRDCRVLLLDEPTRGVDVGARSEIYALIRTLASNGVAIVLVSSEVEEVLGLSDRVVVLREGRAVHTGPAQDIDEHQVLDLVMEGSAV